MMKLATDFVAQSLVGISNAVDGVQGNLAPLAPDATAVIAGVWLPQAGHVLQCGMLGFALMRLLNADDRLMEQLSLAPDGSLAACTDDKGRVLVVDCVSRTIIRAWKGYRDAQVGWLMSSNLSSVSAPGGTPCEQIDSEKEPSKEAPSTDRHVI